MRDRSEPTHEAGETFGCSAWGAVANYTEGTRNLDMTIKFVLNDKGNPAGKLADAELHFTGGPLDGLKLIGFGIWERKTGGRNVTFPARQYSVNGERRSYAMLRPISDVTQQHNLRDLILEAYKEYEDAMTADLRPAAEYSATAY